VARAQDFRGIEYGRHLTFENTYAGFNQLLQSDFSEFKRPGGKAGP
jgi:hypothetical protein